MPTARLKQHPEQPCRRLGIRFLETEEAHTFVRTGGLETLASFLDGDFLPRGSKKPEGWKLIGKQVKCGLLRTSDGWLINADANEAMNTK